MNFKESIKTDWRVNVGIIFFIIFIVSIPVSVLYGNFYIFAITYAMLVGITVFLGVFNEWFDLFIFPVLPIAFWVANDEEKKIKKYLQNNNQNILKSAIVVLAYYDRYHVKYGMKPNYSFGSIKAITEYLRASRGDDFSFYSRASRDDIEMIMLDNNVKEVLFVGHGDSHIFVLNLEDEIYYCDFKDTKYSKDLAHQVHCGTKSGKSLVEYVVPVGNRERCFFFPKSIKSRDIDQWFKKRVLEMNNDQRSK